MYVSNFAKSLQIVNFSFLYLVKDDDVEDYEIFMNKDTNRKKTSYSYGRKLGINVLSNVSALPFQVIVFRAGWMVKNLHSAFDYIFNSKKR